VPSCGASDAVDKIASLHLKVHNWRMEKLQTEASGASVRVFDSPIGPITMSAAGGKLFELTIGAASPAHNRAKPVSERGEQQNSSLTNTEALDLAQQQLSEYFAGKRRQFDLPLQLQGTDFQKRVWEQLGKVAYGHTSSYGILAGEVGSPQAARAVGGAVGANPLPIIIGCHRILAANQALTGYSGGNGLSTKSWLLQHEGIAWRS